MNAVKTSETLKISFPVFPLDSSLVAGQEYKIADHVNLSGHSPKHIGFIPITDLYLDKHNSEAIIIAALKPGVIPTEEEKKVLLANGIKAYAYDFTEDVLFAAANGRQVEAMAFVPKLPKAYKIFSTKAGLKTSGGLDFGVIYSSEPCKAAGVFTTNKARAICVDHNEARLITKQPIQVIACNAGIANAATGHAGKQADLEFRIALAEKFNIDINASLIASTGKIGVQLDISKINKALTNIPESSILDFATAIMTTDTRPKIFQSGSMIGFCKGSGMIAPNMATMLAFIISDYKLRGDDFVNLKQILKDACDKSFNAISVDSDTSTNDMVLLTTNETGEEISLHQFKEHLEKVCHGLAQQIIADGEGLTKVIELNLYTDLNQQDSRHLAMRILNSPLVKTAVFGNDPNWGRIIAAVGNAYSDLKQDLDLNNVSLKILGEVLYQNGQNIEFNREIMFREIQKTNRLVIDLSIGSGANYYQAWGNDLSYDYVKINAEYFT
ncbi:MAG: bifunctional glutamate N-acetyltransferase/amino-acid acetyltransferase ArgJ [Candidatus Caenarcaniphilales bacterium]|jgi:glutamate N-acetyltransferase/amino-acid N-acetyltransferase|nr:bifunctional glutamate N-acetyltransferase/amino-acid acetyltransferase ArgJ [Candidatus Caenarcaniphilales bacterium]